MWEFSFNSSILILILWHYGLCVIRIGIIILALTKYGELEYEYDSCGVKAQIMKMMVKFQEMPNTDN